MSHPDTEWIEVSAHAAERWHQRTDSPGIGPRGAWLHGQRLHVRDLRGDECRYHGASETVLVRRGTVLATVIDRETARQSIRRDIAQHFGGGEA